MSRPVCLQPHAATINLMLCCRDGVVYGCGSTEYGQLPYLRYSGGAGASDGDDEAPERGEITVPTRLRLPFLQVGRCRAAC